MSHMELHSQQSYSTDLIEYRDQIKMMQFFSRPNFAPLSRDFERKCMFFYWASGKTARTDPSKIRQPHPDRVLPNSRASKSVDRRIIKLRNGERSRRDLCT